MRMKNFCFLVSGLTLLAVPVSTSTPDATEDSVPITDPAQAPPDTPETQAELLELVESGGLTRGQLANLYASLAGVQFQPPACVADQEMFTDVPASSPFCPWIEELARRGITTGCTANQYCPGSPVTRSQMAIFVVRAMEACPTLDPVDEMIRVGGVCIDKYEASIWDAPVGGDLIPNNVPLPCNENGQDCDNIYARSVAGVEPRGGITWFQAQAALANSGKRLPTNAEWQMAVRGTPDPGEFPGPEDCNSSGVGLLTTGERDNCVSDFGAFDMVGNLWEWVADWSDNGTVCTNWSSTYGDDLSCVGIGDGHPNSALPAALNRGGSYPDGTIAGPFAIRAADQPSTVATNFGFRGAR